MSKDFLKAAGAVIFVEFVVFLVLWAMLGMEG